MATTPATVKKAKGPRTAVRTTFLVLLWIFTAGIVLQVLLIGLGLFYDAQFLGAHAGLGWMLGHLVGPIVLAVGFFGRLGRTLVIVNIVNLVLVPVLPILAAMRDDAPIVAALHPLVAFAVFAITLYTAAAVRRLVPGPLGSAPRPTTPSAPPVIAGRVPPTPPIPPRGQHRT